MTAATLAAQYQPELTIQMVPRVVREGAPAQVRTPADVLRFAGGLSQASQEAFVVLSLDAKNGLIACDVISVGLLDASLVHPREVFRRAVINGAAAVILAHNHPSGDMSPSAEDVRITRQLVDAGRILDIRILDHVIIGEDADRKPAIFSMRESGVVSFST